MSHEKVYGNGGKENQFHIKCNIGYDNIKITFRQCR